MGSFLGAHADADSSDPSELPSDGDELVPAQQWIPAVAGDTTFPGKGKGKWAPIMAKAGLFRSGKGKGKGSKGSR